MGGVNSSKYGIPFQDILSFESLDFLKQFPKKIQIG